MRVSLTHNSRHQPMEESKESTPTLVELIHSRFLHRLMPIVVSGAYAHARRQSCANDARRSVNIHVRIKVKQPIREESLLERVFER